MEGYIINRTGTFKHVFGRTIGPNEKINLLDLYKVYSLRMTLENFIEHIKNKSNSSGVEVIGVDLLNPETPKEIRIENELKKYQMDVETVTPKILSELEYNDDTKLLISKIDSTRLLTYAQTMARKNGKNKFLQKALARRVKELKRMNK